jgi:hypothetical protein
MHIGSSSSNPAASPDAPEGVGGTLAFNNSMASLADWLFSGKLMQFPQLKLAYSEGQIGWIPYALERADTVWEQHDSWQHSKEYVEKMVADAGLDAETAYKVLRGNAIRMLDLDRV